MTTFGPGTFTIGATGSEFEASCLVNSLTITPSKDVGDATTKLCGTKKPGAVTYSYTLDGNVDTDIEDPAGFFAMCQSMAGTEQTFTYTPNTEAVTSATGTLVIDPLDFGGDEYGADMTSDFSFDLVDAPTYTFPAAAPGASSRFAPVVINAPTIIRPDAKKSESSDESSSDADADAA